MSESVDINSVGQIDNIDTLTFDDADKQTVDLTEVIRYDNQAKVHNMVSGIEQYLKDGVITKSLAEFYNVKLPSGSADPSGGVYNSRFGGEGFLTTILDGLEKGIVAVIRFIKKIVLWCVDKVKFIFGFGPSDRQAEVIATELPKLKEELGSYLTALGFPSHLMDLNTYLDSLPADQRRIPQLKFLTSKLLSDQEALSNITDVIPLADNVLKIIGKNSKAAATNKRKFQDQLKRIANSSRDDYLDSNLKGLETSIFEVINSFSMQDITTALKEMLNKSAGIKVDDDQLQNNFIRINEQLTTSVRTAQVIADSPFVDKINQLVAYSATKDLEVGNAQDLKASLEDLYGISDATELNKIVIISRAADNNDLLLKYQQMTNIVSAYTNFANMTLTVVKNARNTLKDITGWYSDALKFMYAGLSNDIKGIQDVLAKAKASNPNFNVDLTANGLPYKFVMMQDADAQTIIEKISAMSHELIELNVVGAKTSLNKIGSRLGFGKIA